MDVGKAVDLFSGQMGCGRAYIPVKYFLMVFTDLVALMACLSMILKAVLMRTHVIANDST